mgnify:CR=1 FL=1
MYWPTILSVLGYMAAIGTIDIGGTGDIHTKGAIISTHMRHWDARFMSKCSILQKIVVATYLSIIWVYCLVGLIMAAIYPD